MVEPRFPFVLIDVDEGEADVASGLLFEMGAQGVEERDATTLVKGTPGKVTLSASFATHEEAAEAIDAFDESMSPRLEEIVGDGWRDEWKKHFRPFEICAGVVVRPPWESYTPKDATPRIVLELEPGRAFGTGLHETTSLVAGALAAHRDELQGKTIFDVGCGSGILALVALKLGASHARAMDVDPDAVEVTRENAIRNDMASLVTVDTNELSAIDGTFPVVVANIEARVLIPLARELMSKVAAGGLLVLSGILAPQKDDVVAAYANFALLDAPAKGEWVALAFRAPNGR